MIVISLLSCIFSRGGTKGPKSVEYAWNERRDVTAEPCSAGTAQDRGVGNMSTPGGA
jgi:hypothetical protein